MRLLSPEPASLLVIFIAFATLLLWVAALFDIFRSRFRQANEQTFWAVLVFLMPVAGALLYFFLGRKNRIQ